ncbi:hypothetical protein DPMN_115542 [Dreissena polymorpha]|uniref:Uncharacterized protein n=1 Tax=Dreissena polymorpha TaxID=45954 RepID=A0A9D4QSQ5_DREPO|nr:hypothetical protein DPMN_115542 [Dreissena polymorpha]
MTPGLVDLLQNIERTTTGKQGSVRMKPFSISQFGSKPFTCTTTPATNTQTELIRTHMSVYYVQLNVQSALYGKINRRKTTIVKKINKFNIKCTNAGQT